MAKVYYIGDFLKRIKRPITLNDNQDYNLVTIKRKEKGFGNKIQYVRSEKRGLHTFRH